MSAESIKRILERFSTQVVQACNAGQGEELFRRFLTEMAADAAKTTFLKMDEVVSKANADDGKSLWEWVQAFPEQCGLDLVESAASTFRTFGASEEQIEAAVLLTAEAFSDQLNELFERASMGGCA